MTRRTHTTLTDLYEDYQDLMGEAAAARDHDDKITACPICGAEIQSTVEVWRSGVTLTASCDEVVSPGVYVDEETPRVYCANDHTMDEMITATTN